MFFIAATWAQTGTVKGTVIDQDSDEPLVGANVVIKGTYNGTITEVDGSFQLGEVPAGQQTLIISFVGFDAKEVTAKVISEQTTDIGEINVAQSAVGLNEVQVIASVAIDRKTPVAVSTIKGEVIEQKLGNQEFPEVLKFTPSVYVTKQGGGFGDSRINIRGFDQRNTAVLINGVPVNDMENGWVYWSNWAGLSDVTSSIQQQRGLSASKLAVSSVGGTINIITNAAEMTKGGAVSASFGNDGYQKYGLMLSTGLGENGWAFTVQGTHTFGDGYVDGTKFKGWSYFASLAKEINSQHSLHLTVLGAPQWHNQRSYANPITDYIKYGEKYNSDWGYKDGKEFSNRKNFYHKPIAYLNHYWDISEKTELATSVYASFGRGGGTGDLGSINGNAIFRSAFKTENGTLRFDDIQRWNQGNSVPDFNGTVTDKDGNVLQELGNKQPWVNGGGFDGQFVGTSGYDVERDADGRIIRYKDLSEGGIIRRSSMNEHNWFGILSNLTHEITDELTLVGGLDARYYKGIHYRRVENLLGQAAYFDDDNVNNPEHYVTSEGNSDEKIDYYNDGLVNWLGVFGQLEYDLDPLTVFASVSVSNQGFKRIEYFAIPDNDPARETDWQNFLGGTVKAGANYNIDSRNNVFINGGYFSQQPIFDNVIDFSNNVDPDIENQNIYGLEAGYGFRGAGLTLNLNLYNTLWTNRQITRSITLNGLDGTANFKGIGQLHQGIEMDFAYQPVRQLTLNGMLSLGNWRYTKNFKATVFDDDQNQIGETTLYMEDVKVPDAAQTTMSLGATYEVINGLNLFATYYFADRVFADFDIASDNTFNSAGNQAWELPSYSLLDVGLAYTFDVAGLNCTVNLNVNNLLDKTYISESDTNVLYDPTEGGMEYGTNGSVANRVFYGFGRTWNTGLKVRF